MRRRNLLVRGVVEGGFDGVDPGADFSSLLPNESGGHVSGPDSAFSSEEVGEVEPGGGATEIKDGRIVSTSGGDRGGVRAEPDSGALVGLPYLSHPLSPLPHPNPLIRPVHGSLPSRRSLRHRGSALHAGWLAQSTQLPFYFPELASFETERINNIL